MLTRETVLGLFFQGFAVAAASLTWKYTSRFIHKLLERRGAMVEAINPRARRGFRTSPRRGSSDNDWRECDVSDGECSTVSNGDYLPYGDWVNEDCWTGLSRWDG